MRFFLWLEQEFCDKVHSVNSAKSFGLRETILTKARLWDQESVPGGHKLDCSLSWRW